MIQQGRVPCTPGKCSCIFRLYKKVSCKTLSIAALQPFLFPLAGTTAPDPRSLSINREPPFFYLEIKRIDDMLCGNFRY